MKSKERRIAAILILIIISLGCTNNYSSDSSFKNFARPDENGVAVPIVEDTITLANIPFELIRNQIIIKGKVNNSEIVNLIFDSGSEISIIDSLFADTLGLLIDSTAEMHCTSGIKSLNITTCDYKICGFELKNTKNIISNFEQQSRILKIPIAGIIGHDIFKSNIVKFDFINGIIKIFKSNYEYHNQDYQEFELTRGPAIIAELTMQNGEKISGRYIIDTGSSGAVSISRALIDNSTIDSLKASNKISYSYDICGNKQMHYKKQIANFMFGDFEMGSLLASISIAKKGIISDDSQYAGLIGMKVLKEFDIIVDYRKSKIYFKKSEQ